MNKTIRDRVKAESRSERLNGRAAVEDSSENELESDDEDHHAEEAQPSARAVPLADDPQAPEQVPEHSCLSLINLSSECLLDLVSTEPRGTNPALPLASAASQPSPDAPIPISELFADF